MFFGAKYPFLSHMAMVRFEYSRHQRLWEDASEPNRGGWGGQNKEEFLEMGVFLEERAVEFPNEFQGVSGFFWWMTFKFRVKKLGYSLKASFCRQDVVLIFLFDGGKTLGSLKNSTSHKAIYF